MELPREWEAIVNQHQCGSGCYTVQYAVERCYALHCKPQRELTDAEIVSIRKRLGTPLSGCVSFARDVIAAHQRKQQEPETVKFRAARNKQYLTQIEMLPAGVKLDGASIFEWLPGEPQEIEVKLP